jgi:hypothetical protein
MLQGFINACDQVGVVPFAAETTAVKVALRCFLPHVFTVGGQHISLGVEWGNSDFGCGKMQVSTCIWFASGNKFSVLSQVLGRVHIGSIIEDSEIEMSEETARKEAEAQVNAIRDAVRSHMSVGNVTKLLQAIERAHAETLSWDKIRPILSKILSKTEVTSIGEMLESQQDGVHDLPPVNYAEEGTSASKWWMVSAISKLAANAESERRSELEQFAGSLLSPFVSCRNANDDA